jgi:hypothetical protein
MPLPEGYTLEQPSAAQSVAPSQPQLIASAAQPQSGGLPPGYTLEQPSAAQPSSGLPPGYTIEGQPAKAPRDVGTGVVPQSSMVDKVLGALAPQPVPQSKDAGLKQGEEGGFEGSYASGDTGKAAFMTGAGGATLLTMLGANYGPGALAAIKAAAESHPLVAKVLRYGMESIGVHDLYKTVSGALTSDEKK